MDNNYQVAIGVVGARDCANSLDQVEHAYDPEVGPKVGEVACDDQLGKLLSFASDQQNSSFSNNSITTTTIHSAIDGTRNMKRLPAS